MSWFIFALICVLGWGLADLFYKKSSDPSDRYSHLRLAVWVGLIMGVVSLILLPFSESRLSGGSLLENAVKYLPASLGYIISMVIGYAGLRYLEVSIVSPVQNASGALSMIFMLIWFTVRGKISDLSEEYSALDFAGTALIVAGVMFGVGALVEASANISACEGEQYDFAELAEGILLNMNAPLAGGFGLVANFMALVDFQDGTVEGGRSINPVPYEAYDKEGNIVWAYKWDYEDGDYYREVLAFRSNLGLSWRTSGKRFGLEFYPLDFVVAPGDSRFTLSLDAVFRLF